jgi:tubulin polyglutamylase TTLL4
MIEYLKENPLDPDFEYVKFSSDEQLPKNSALKYYQSGYTAILIRKILQTSGFVVTKKRSSAILIVGNSLPKNEFSKLTRFQKTNHYQQTNSIGSKEGLDSVMKSFFRKIRKRLPFYPETYHLPREFSDLSKAFSSSKLWISKPASGARGIGIQVIDKMPKATGVNLIIQKYIADPMLINSLKFDLRFYVAVTSIDPLIVFVYENGLVRLATKPYEESLSDLSNRAAHLTNFSINKNMEGFVATNDIANDGTGNKWSHRPFWPYLAEHGFDPEKIKSLIDDAIVQTIIAATRSLRSQRNAEVSYELFGFDVAR